MPVRGGDVIKVAARRNENSQQLLTDCLQRVAIATLAAGRPPGGRAEVHGPTGATIRTTGATIDGIDGPRSFSHKATRRWVA